MFAAQQINKYGPILQTEEQTPDADARDVLVKCD